MATESINKKFSLDHDMAKQIIRSKPTKIIPTNTFNDIKLSKEERISKAKGILKSKRWK
ncbi:hypothetical protein LC040_03620 [Bacillus tianshenii]|nr:hypothetical protein LC040_03620 [Bacillus tianshenii]